MCIMNISLFPLKFLVSIWQSILGYVWSGLRDSILEASVMLRSWVEYSKCVLFTDTSYIVFDIVVLFQYWRGHGTLYMWYILTVCLDYTKW